MMAGRMAIKTPEQKPYSEAKAMRAEIDIMKYHMNKHSQPLQSIIG
jgi:hypothetical protein